MKSIILPVTRDSDVNCLAASAAKLADRFDATLTGLFIRRDPKHAIPLLGEGLTAEMIQEMCDATQREGLRFAAKAEASFNAAAAAAEIDTSQENVGSSSVALWRLLVGDISDHVGRCARTADFAVCERPQGKNSAQSEIFNDLVFRSGRSVLMLPEAYSGPMLDNLLVAWNGRAECARAVGGALPVLKKASKVSILQVGDLGEDRPTLDDIGFYLKTHGITANHIRQPKTDTSVGATVLQTAHEINANSIVIGAFSTARWRELILGGVTKHLIEHSQLPIYMSH